MRPLILLSVIVATTLASEPQPPPAPDFRYEILPLLHRHGCGSAYCHGSATGRGGFKLSLFGSDPRADHLAISNEFGGRRLDLLDPHASLLLEKPTRALPHGGGRVLGRDSTAYDALVGWIAAGAPYQSGDELHLDGLELTLAGDRLAVRATFLDGAGASRQRDVTDLCTFRSSDESVMTVDDAGRVRRGEPGEAWLFARYVNETARLAVVQPFGAVTARRAGPAVVDAAHPLDRVWLQRLERLGLRAGPTAAREQLARRLYLDLAGRLPEPAELRAFDGPRAVAAVAERLMSEPGFALTFGRHLAEWFEVPLEPPERRSAMATTFVREHETLVEAVAAGESLGGIVRRFLVEDRRLLDRHRDPRDRAELCGRAVLGIRIGCARCHDSPVDRWRRRDHLGFSSLFASPRPAPGGGTRPGVLFHPETGEPVEPALLPTSGTRRPRADHGSPELLAWFALDADNDLFARNVANRVFAALVGRGLVEPVDDHRPSNPAVHEPVLEHLAAIARSGDLRLLVGHIVTSRLYQASSVPGSAGEREFFARREARPLEPWRFGRAIELALACELPAEPLPDSPLARQLALQNGTALHAAVDRSPVLRELAQRPAREQLDELFALLLSRSPADAEVRKFLPRLREERDLRDLAYALIATREFGSIR